MLVLSAGSALSGIRIGAFAKSGRAVLYLISYSSNLKPCVCDLKECKTNRTDLQPDHINMPPSQIERFLTIFKQCIDLNPVHYVDNEQELELCLGCMQNPADVKVIRQCGSLRPLFVGGPTPCTQCACRVLWCCSCMGRWWAACAQGPPKRWLWGRATCPMCRASFCILDVAPARVARS